MKSLQNEILQTVQCMKDQVFIVTFFPRIKYKYQWCNKIAYLYDLDSRATKICVEISLIVVIYN